MNCIKQKKEADGEKERNVCNISENKIVIYTFFNAVKYKNSLIEYTSKEARESTQVSN